MLIKSALKQNKFDFIVFIFTALLYFVNNFILKSITKGIANYFFTGYFNDLICPLGFVAYTNILLFFINKKIDKFYHILFFCFLCGIVWEFIAPLLKETSVTDPYDLLCYCIGGTLYWIIKFLISKINILKNEK